MPVSVGELLAYLRLDSSGFDRGIKVAQSEMRSATGTADRMGTAVGTTGERLAGAGRAAQVAASGSAKYRAAQLSLVAAQERYNTVLNQGSASTGRLASAEASVIRANERVAASSRAATASVASLGAAQRRSNEVVAATPGLMGRTASGFGRAARSAIGLGAAFGAFELARKAIDISKDAAKFQQSMLLIQTNAGKSAAEVKFMTDAVLKMSPEVATKPLDLANALYHVEQNGLTGTRALEALRAGAEGAKIGLADVEDTTNTMTIAVASGIHGIGDMQKAMGTMIAIAGTGDMRLKDLNGALSTGILAVAKGFLSSKTAMFDVGAVLATLGDNGIRTNDAATALRQTMMGFAQPAAKGKAALEGIGLSMTSLSDDMQKHGLVAAMNDLSNHMIAAGITGSKVGAFITEAFGKKAGAGVGILMGEVDRINGKFKDGIRGGQEFGAKWAATTHTTAFAFQRLGAEFEAAGIKLMQSVGPAAANVATWLGTNVPRAIKTLADILAPTASLVGKVFVTAWHALAAVLSVAAIALGVIGGAAKAARGDLGRLALVALTIYGSFKTIGYGIVIFKAIQTAIILTRVRLLELGVAFRGLAAAEATMGIGSLAAAASVGAVGTAATAGALAARRAALGYAALRFAALASVSVNSDQIEVMKELIGQYKMSTNSSDMSAQAIIRWAATTTRGMAGMLKFKSVLHDLNMTSDQLAKGVSGSDAAYKAFIATAKEHGKVTSDDKELLDKLHGAFKNTTADADKAAGANRKLTAAQKASAAAAKATAAAIDKIAGSTKIGSDVAKHYATMMGIIVNKEGVAAASAPQVTAAIQTMANAYNTASASGSDFLASLDTFSTSAGTAADRAALIGATLKANAGDALGFAAAINATATANKQLGADVKQTASQITKGGESTRTYLRSIVNLKNGTIDYHNAASGPLINDLQTIQTNAINAAVATYQHNRALMGGKAAADSAVSGYMGVEHSLEGQLEKLGLTSKAAKDLTQKYLGVPKNVRTAIKQEGADPIVAVLDRIGQLLANLTGQSWDIGVNVIVNKIINATAGVQGSKNNDPRLSGKASGGGLPEGVSAVGELGPELAVKSGGHVQILSNAQSKQYLSATGMKAPGFASGTLNPHTFQRSLGGDGSSERTAFQSMLDVGNKAGISQALAKELIAENKVLGREIALRNRYADRLKAANQRLADAQKKLADEAAAVKGAITGSFDVTSAGTGFDGQQPITGANMIAEEKQAATRAHAFVAAIKKLKGRIGAGYLYQLAEKGPGALPEAQALLSLNRSDLKAFNASAASLNTSGNQLGSYIGGMRFGGQVHRDAAVVAADRARLRAENRTVDHLGKKIVQQLERGIERLSHPKITVYLDGKKIATAVASGAKKNGARN